MARYTSKPSEIEHLRRISKGTHDGRITVVLPGGAQFTGYVKSSSHGNNAGGQSGNQWAYYGSVTIAFDGGGEQEFDMLDIDFIVPAPLDG